MLIIQYLNVIG